MEDRKEATWREKRSGAHQESDKCVSQRSVFSWVIRVNGNARENVKREEDNVTGKEEKQTAGKPPSISWWCPF